MVPKVHLRTLDPDNEILSPAGDIYQQSWTKFSKNYLPLLRPWRTAVGMRTEPRIGDIVIVKTPLPRATWPLAKVVRLFPNPDGEVRSVDILINGKESRRETSQLFLIEPRVENRQAKIPDNYRCDSSEETPEKQCPVLLPSQTRSGRVISRPLRFQP